MNTKLSGFIMDVSGYILDHFCSKLLTFNVYNLILKIYRFDDQF